MDIKRKNEIVTELLKNSPPNVNTVGFGFKITNGVLYKMMLLSIW